MMNGAFNLENMKNGPPDCSMRAIEAILAGIMPRRQAAST